MQITIKCECGNEELWQANHKYFVCPECKKAYKLTFERVEYQNPAAGLKSVKIPKRNILRSVINEYRED